jgi:hypothetical protein
VLSPTEWQHYLGTFAPYGAWVPIAAITRGFVLRLILVLKAKREDIPEIARAIFRRSKDG